MRQGHPVGHEILQVAQRHAIRLLQAGAQGRVEPEDHADDRPLDHFHAVLLDPDFLLLWSACRWRQDQKAEDWCQAEHLKLMDQMVDQINGLIGFSDRKTLVDRLAPWHGPFLLTGAVANGAALAVGQSNGKKVLAYSTISNLGLIFACAGINTAESMIAAMLLLMFHAVIKALLFLSVGAIEQRIASRDIEDMRGLYAVMPVTALITVTGVVMMIMPPFGVLLSKWMAMEAAARNLYVIIMIALASALTVMYWARWAGTLMSDPFAGRFRPERQPVLTWLALGPLCAGGALLSVVAPWLYLWMIKPVLGGSYTATYALRAGVMENAYGTFAILPLCAVALLGLVVAVIALKRAFRSRIVAAYMSGIQTSEPFMFLGPMNQPVKAEARNYYLDSIFGEKRLTDWVNLGGGILLTLILGGAL